MSICHNWRLLHVRNHWKRVILVKGIFMFRWSSFGVSNIAERGQESSSKNMFQKIGFLFDLGIILGRILDDISMQQVIGI